MLDSGPCAPAFNMALDEALLGCAQESSRPVLRFYGWTAPAASFGYFQKVVEVERATLLRPLIRRPTAGGIVPHDADWTYSVAIPAGHDWHGLKATQSYRRMHEWICSTFENMGITTQLAQDSLKPAPGQCFAGHETHDVLWQGRKIAGAAQRRTRTGLLIQGSIQPPPLKLERKAWQQALCDNADVVWEQRPINSEVLSLASRLADEKYSTDMYNRRR